MADCFVTFCNILMTSEVPWKQSIGKQVVGFIKSRWELSLSTWDDQIYFRHRIVKNFHHMKSKNIKIIFKNRQYSKLPREDKMKSLKSVV